MLAWFLALNNAYGGSAGDVIVDDGSVKIHRYKRKQIVHRLLLTDDPLHSLPILVVH